MVPTGTFSVMSPPSRPVLLEPSPWRPRSALYSGLKRKWTSVLWRSLDSMMTSPPLPPSPPEGPPRGTNFSRRNAMQPLPPSPAFTTIFASSINIGLSMIAEYGQECLTGLETRPDLFQQPAVLEFRTDSFGRFKRLLERAARFFRTL